ncbi:phosphoribosylanthranilate isomerase [Blattabacterium cuenoti]|uniref:phosphoribosylanthranilate isomerase n=1 Tax=Blattabacterium cuenoti TaxID=1653831 RepID=UPI00163B9F48|nr:phosphoribosylanthranilate isomerase [Blattabacterium cuenoti]
MKNRLLKIKICGIKYDIKDISSLDPDFMGFIFYPKSPRFVGSNFFLPKLKKGILKTGVFVNETEDNLLKISKDKKLDFVQLHGNETPFYCEKILKKGLKIIKTFHIDKTFSFNRIQDYISLCNYFLFDTRIPLFYGGSGKKFCWKRLYEYNLDVPFFLSGGIGIEDLEKIKKFFYSNSKMFGIDVNSRFEIKPGKKNKISLNNFIREIKEKL